MFCYSNDLIMKPEKVVEKELNCSRAKAVQ